MVCNSISAAAKVGSQNLALNGGDFASDRKNGYGRCILWMAAGSRGTGFVNRFLAFRLFFISKEISQ